MVFKKRTGNFVQGNTYPQSSKEIPAPPAVTESLSFAQRIAMNATLAVIVVLALLVPVYSQQETDPTWYDPWAANQVVVQRPQSRPADRKKGKSNQPRPQDAKARDQQVSKRLALTSALGRLPQSR